MYNPATLLTRSTAPLPATHLPATRGAKEDKSEIRDTRYLAIDGGRIAYDDTGGPGPLVVALPGMGDLRSQYRALRPLLLRAEYRVVTMDVRGFGDSSAAWDDLSARAVGSDVVRLIEHLQAGSAVVLGNSFAAGSALWAARQAPNVITGVALLGPIVRDGPPNALAQLALKLGFAGPWRVWFWTTYWSSLFPSRKPADHEQARAALVANLHEPGRMDALRTMVSLSKVDTEALVANSRVPALVVMGTNDPDFKDPRAEAEWLANALSADLHMVEGAGHYPHLERVDLVAPKLLQFLDRVTASLVAAS